MLSIAITQFFNNTLFTDSYLNYHTMRGTRKLHFGLAGIMMAILLGSALLGPTTAFADKGSDSQKNGKNDQDKTGQDKTGQDKTGQDKTGQDKTTKETETKEKDRKDKDTNNDDHKEKKCESEKYDKECEEHGKDLAKDIADDTKDIKNDNDKITQATVDLAKDKLHHGDVAKDQKALDAAKLELKNDTADLALDKKV